MENNIGKSSKTPSLPINEITGMKDKLVQYRDAIPVSFVLVIIFFFFGFCNFKCNGTKVASLKGINLVTGTHLKTPMNSMLNENPFNMGSDTGKSAKGEKVPANFWAIIAFLSAITGAVVFYRKEEKETRWGTILGVTGFISLLILQLVIKSKIEDHGGMIHIEASFLFGYWASLLAFIVAGGISYLRLKQEKQAESTTASANNPPTPIHINVITQHQENDNL